MGTTLTYKGQFLVLHYSDYRECFSGSKLSISLQEFETETLGEAVDIFKQAVDKYNEEKKKELSEKIKEHSSYLEILNSFTDEVIVGKTGNN